MVFQKDYSIFLQIFFEIREEQNNFDFFPYRFALRFVERRASVLSPGRRSCIIRGGDDALSTPSAPSSPALC